MLNCRSVLLRIMMTDCYADGYDKKIVVFGRCIFRRIHPIASWVETGGSGTTPIIRLQGPFVRIQGLPKKPSKSYDAV